MHWEALERRLLLSGQAVNTLVLFKVAGAGNHAPPGATLIQLTSGTDLTLQDLTGGSPVTAAYTYASTGATTATLVRQAADGTHTLNFTYTTANSGTIQQIDPDGTSTDIFVLNTVGSEFSAPSSLAGADYLFTIATGGGVYPTSGSWRAQMAATANTYTNTKQTTNLSDSTGTYSYTQAVDGATGLASFTWVDSSAHSGKIFLAFATASGGIFYNIDQANSSNPADFLEGPFTPTSIFTATTTAVASNFNPAGEGSAVIFTATVTPHIRGADTATGTVIFEEGATVLGTGTLTAAGTATLSIATLPRDQHSITAVYSGDTNFAASTSPAIGQTVVYSHTTHENYVKQLYTDLFRRPADPAGLATWSSLLDHGQETIAEVATTLTSSREYDGIVVDSFYFQYLGRHAEPGGITYWVDQMQSGLNAEVIRAGILGSEEYFVDTGGTNTTLVTALYDKFLNRAPEAGGLAYWLSQLNTQSHAQVSSAISSSDENRTGIVTGFYQTYMQRNPDPSGLAFWKNLLAHGVTQPQIISSFVTSPEYLALHQIS